MAEQVKHAEPAAVATASATKKRRRPPLSCEQCRRRKIKCDRAFPCGHCVRAGPGPGGAVTCTYAPTHTPKPSRRKAAPASRRPEAAAAAAAAPLSSSSSSSSQSQSSPDDTGGSMVSLRPPTARAVSIRPTARATQISTPDSEEFHRASAWQPLRPSEAARRSAPPQVGWSAAVDGGREQQGREPQSPPRQQQQQRAALVGKRAEAPPASRGEARREGDDASRERHRSEFTPPPKGSISKGRYFGQSHWMNIAASFPVQLSMLKNQEHTQGELFQLLHQCKVLCQQIKNSRVAPLSSLNIGKTMLPRDVCDDLVEAYLATYEGVYRVLHVPTFRREYAAYWADPAAAAAADEAFVVLLQLCLVLGSTVRAQRPAALKATAVRWIYEAHTWLILPPEKGRMTLTGIQIQCLLTLAKMTCGVSADLTWVMAGGLLRTAMYMGLHRDPSRLADMTVFRAEMRRRLWATILELNLLYAFEAGGMPLLTCDDYDVLPPADLDDDALDDVAIDDVGRRVMASNVATHMSVPLEVFRSFPVRLALLQYINDFRAGIDYDKTLRLNAELTKACRAFSRTVATLGDATAAGRRIRPFHISLAEVTLYRCFHALHFPVLFTAFDDPRFYFSRKMCLDGALKIADLVHFSSSPPPPATTTDFAHLAIHGTGMFKNIPVQAACIIALELIHDKSGGGRSGGLGHAGGEDLRACLGRALDWTLDRMRAGEVTAKGHCFLSACIAHTDALDQGLDKTATMALLEEPPPPPGAEDPVAAAGWDGGNWAWDENDDWMWGGAWSQLNVPMPLDDVHQFFAAPVGYMRQQ
ncbi:C6 zinc finger domain-containing protein [Cordyceps militaris CM01]|uniref:C6 zinc finger domain-containing protein n=1 Tax=Cordyceps militaris (strain CM01) TaxID=983644 RepID=G3JGW5_CORMM|nr:C6 zinc finger domain-containing protein [Cordyceps militaris CM01]EGX91521.1 C6 zinc finger domain-containing protein [Cordyceps militaris CM01]